MTSSKKTIKYLRTLTHHLSPVVLLGAQGLTANVHREIDKALQSHELIKIKLGNIENEQQKQWIDHIIETHQAVLVQWLGHTASFYRENKKERKIIIPKEYR